MRATLRLTDRRHVKAEPPKDRGHAFQLTTEDAKVAPYVVAGMSLSFTSFFYICVMLD